MKRIAKIIAFLIALGGLFVFWLGSFHQDKMIAVLSVVCAFLCVLTMMCLIAESIEKEF